MITDNIQLADLQNENCYDFLEQIITNNADGDVQFDDSPYSNINLNCQYFEEQEVIDKFKDLNKISFLSWNIQSLPSKFTELKDFLDFHREQGFSFDIIALQEIWTIHDEDLFNLENYNFFFKQRQLRRGGGGVGGGVGIYVNKNFKVNILPQYSIFIEKVFESIFIEVELEDKKKIYISSVYRPNSIHPTLTQTQQLDQFIELFSELQNNISSFNDVYIMGDFNIDILKFQSHSKTGEFVDNSFSNGFIQLITKPTRVINGSATLIDHLYTNSKQNSFASGIILSRISDHFPICHFNTGTKTKKSPKFIYTRNFSEDNINNFKASLSNLSWENVLNKSEVQHSFDEFSEIFNTLFQTFFPVLKTKFNKNIHKIEPFMTKGLLVSRCQKLKLSSLSIKQPTELNINNFKSYRNIYNKLLTAAKKNYYESSLEENKYNLRKTWQILREATRKLNDKSSIINKIKANGVVYENEDDISLKFNEYFTTIADTIAKEINPSDRPPDEFVNQLDCEFSMGPVDPTYLHQLVSKMPAKRSMDNFGISNSFMKKIIECISLPLSHIFTLSIEKGQVPAQLKVAKVVPIFKFKKSTEEESLNLNNYRPISLLPILSKLLEKIVAERLTEYLKTNNILYEHQYGFQAKKSTVHPMIHLLNKVSDAMNDNKITVGVFCDLKKCFDTCSHQIIFKKLEKIGVKNRELDWFKSYLSDRKQFASINSKNSPELPINKGVPQGSILGPILFLVYVNDLASCTSLFTLLFADDTSFLISGKNLNEIVQILNVELQKVCNWFRSNELSLHPEKTQFMIFTNNESKINWEQINIVLNYNNFNENDENKIKKLSYINSKSEIPAIKFLGVFMDPKLNFKFHIEQVRKKIAKSLYIIKCAKNILNEKALLTLYRSLVHTHLLYCIQVWSCCNPSSLKPLILLQKKAIRIVTNSKYNAHTAPLFQATGILPLQELCDFTKLQFFYDFINNKLPTSFQGQWSRNNERIIGPSLRNALEFNIPTPRLTSIENFPNFALPRLWNRLLLESTLSSEMPKRLFNKTLKNYLLNNLNTTCTRLLCPNCHL